MHFRAFRHLHIDEVLALVDDMLWVKLRRRLKEIRVVHHLDEVANHRINRLWRETDDSAVVVNAKQKVAACLVEESADRLEGVRLRTIRGFLELDVHVLANGEKRTQS